MNRLVYHSIRIGAKYLSPLISLFEYNVLKKVQEESQSPSAIFIVGSPRSGSTFLYQLITNSCKVLYINNFIALFHRNLYSGFILNERYIGLGDHNCFSSELGKTLKYGWKAPSESGNFWYNWLSRNSGYKTSNLIPDKKIEQIRRVILAIINRYNKPFVIKNLNNSLRLPLIKRALPKSKVIWIKRDPKYIAQSILIARRKKNIPSNQVWSVNPFETVTPDYSSEIEMVVHQIHRIEKMIMSDLKKNELETIIINYENLSQELPKLSEFCSIAEISSNNVKSKNRKLVNATEWKQIEYFVSQLDWDN